MNLLDPFGLWAAFTPGNAKKDAAAAAAAAAPADSTPASSPRESLERVLNEDLSASHYDYFSGRDIPGPDEYELREHESRIRAAFARLTPDRGERLPVHDGPLATHPWVQSLGLDAEVIGQIEAGARAVVSFPELMAERDIEPDSLLLGRTSVYRARIVYDAIVGSRGNLGTWQEAYDRFGIPKEKVEANPELLQDFMARLAGSGRTVYFLLDGIAEQDCVATREELQWFLDHPEAMANVVFVYGSERCKTENEWTLWERAVPNSAPARYNAVGKPKMLEDFRARGWADTPSSKLLAFRAAEAARR